MLPHRHRDNVMIRIQSIKRLPESQWLVLKNVSYYWRKGFFFVAFRFPA